ncbi:hypothetical protein BJF83_15715 [Nocardiopsis sp. CNR-923]|uniref:hypothetical protein n=1 Tax=Nocardiopsis sp. CNR-923 TaxID=1904965 RepID=UPI00095C907A|nr:hypothetical protein [Nocardiopsis sp. CNR-923]OLT28328.1 hypothetical protein BJF83_15715 [Nocardiopsis sp. CNR-923]
MNKALVTALLALGALGLAAPAHADTDSNFGEGVNAADGWGFVPAAVCLQEVAQVPALGDGVGGHANHCSNGNVVGHSG